MLFFFKFFYPVIEVLTMPIRLPPKRIFVMMTPSAPHYMNEGRHRCPNSARAALYPKLCQTSSSTSQTRKPALLTFIPSDSQLALYAAIVNNTKPMQGHHTPSPAAPLSIVAVTANETPASLQGRSCIGASSRSAPGFGQPFS